jgi:hypothetical protein
MLAHLGLRLKYWIGQDGNVKSRRITYADYTRTDVVFLVL